MDAQPITSSLTRFDAPDWLETPEAVREFLIAAAEEGETKFLSDSFSVVVRAKGFDAFAEAIGASPGDLRAAVAAEGGPDGVTLLDVMGALGWRLRPIREERAEAA